MKHVCPYCEVGDLTEVRYSCSVKDVQVDGLAKFVCPECGEESVSLDLYEKNTELIKAAQK